MLTGIIVGYDPGGNGNHGLAALHIKDGKATSLETQTMETAEEVILFLKPLSSILAFGVDTLTCWSTGASGWRPADRWLRNQYQDVRNSVINPNALRGAMCLNGVAVLIEMAKVYSSSVIITETHPKVLYRCLFQEVYDYTNNNAAMNISLAKAIGLNIAETANEHEWDAAASALAAFKGISNCWKHDLHNINIAAGERLVWPSSNTKFYWPE